MNKIIQQLNVERASRTFPEFNPGDTVVVQVRSWRVIVSAFRLTRAW